MTQQPSMDNRQSRSPLSRLVTGLRRDHGAHITRVLEMPGQAGCFAAFPPELDPRLLHAVRRVMPTNPMETKA